MDRETKYLGLTKIGFLLWIVPWLIAFHLGTIAGLTAAAIFLTSFGGVALWGFSYGALHEMEE